jgi:hypothetical protein
MSASRVAAAALASALLLGGMPAAAEDGGQRVELAQIGVAATFPAGWHVMAPAQPRE